MIAFNPGLSNYKAKRMPTGGKVGNAGGQKGANSKKNRKVSKTTAQGNVNVLTLPYCIQTVK